VIERICSILIYVNTQGYNYLVPCC